MLKIRQSILSWIILGFAAANVIFLGGKRRAFGVFITYLNTTYSQDGISLSELNWIGDSYSAFGYLTTSFSSAIIIHFGCRYGLFQFIGSLFVLASCITSAVVIGARQLPHWLFLTHTLLHGIGSSLILSAVGLVVNEHFEKTHRYRILATTLVSGGSIASIGFIALFGYLIDRLEWENTFFVLGAIYFFVTGSASIVFRKREDVVAEEKSAKGFRESLRMISTQHVPLLLLWFLDRVMISVVTYGVLMNLSDYVYNRLHSKSYMKSQTLTMLFAAGEASTYLIGAIITFATQRFFKNRLKYILLGTSILMSASLITLEFTLRNQVARRLLCFLAGFGLGPSITFLFPAGEELTRLPGHIAYPFSLGGMGFGMMVSPFFSAIIIEHFKYKYFFLVQGCLIGFKVLCLLSIIVLLRLYQCVQRPQYARLFSITEPPPSYNSIGQRKLADDD